MAGLDGMSDWLNARLFMTNFRPVPLQEHAVFQGLVYAKQTEAGMSGPCDKSLGTQMLPL
jgi:hypothetical protein